jgi:NADH dehydrogenase FAD-containing subunit
MTARRDEKILVIGGGFGGARAAQELCKAGFTNVTLVDRKSYFEVTYATLRGVVEPQVWGAKSRKAYTDFLLGKFIQGAVTVLDENEARLSTGETVDFDFAVIATGTSYPTFTISKPLDQLTTLDRTRHIESEHLKLDNARSVLILGGGPVGVEFAGEIASYYKNKEITLVHDRDRLLNGFNERCAKIALRKLNDLGVQVVLNETIRKKEGEDNTYVSIKTERVYKADSIHVCAGPVVQTAMMNMHFGDCLDNRGVIKVDPFLMVKGRKNFFAVGDCNDVKEMKLGYLADIQGKAAAANLVRLIDGQPLKPYKPHPLLALIPIGRAGGVVQTPLGATTLKFLVNLKQKDLFIKRALGNLGTRPGL